MHRSPDPADHPTGPGRGSNPSSTCVAGVFVLAAVAALALHRRSIPIPEVRSAADNTGILVTRINPNTATMAELTTLPGIGPAKAKRIIEFRVSHHDTSNPPAYVFRRAEDLAGVKGIGPKTVQRLRPWLCFDGR